MHLSSGHVSSSVSKRNGSSKASDGGGGPRPSSPSGAASILRPPSSIVGGGAAAAASGIASTPTAAILARCRELGAVRPARRWVAAPAKLVANEATARRFEW